MIEGSELAQLMAPFFYKVAIRHCFQPAVMGIAVFSENSTLLAHAANMWRQRTPAYFYNIVDGNWVSTY